MRSINCRRSVWVSCNEANVDKETRRRRFAKERRQEQNKKPPSNFDLFRLLHSSLLLDGLERAVWQHRIQISASIWMMAIEAKSTKSNAGCSTFVYRWATNENTISKRNLPRFMSRMRNLNRTLAYQRHDYDYFITQQRIHRVNQLLYKVVGDVVLVCYSFDICRWQILNASEMFAGEHTRHQLNFYWLRYLLIENKNQQQHIFWLRCCRI